MELLLGLILLFFFGLACSMAKGTVDEKSVDHEVFEFWEDCARAILKWTLILGPPGALFIYYVWKTH